MLPLIFFQNVTASGRSREHFEIAVLPLTLPLKFGPPGGNFVTSVTAHVTSEKIDPRGGIRVRSRYR